MPAPEIRFETKVVELDNGLWRAGVSHAFGGAIALAYYAEPRATVDIDLNIFVPDTEGAPVLHTLSTVGVEVHDAAPAEIARDGQCRVHWGATPVDLFFADLPLHAAMERSLRLVPFADREIPILAPEHLMVCKSLFNRPKDWLDIEQMLIAVPDLRVDEVTTWMEAIAGREDLRTQRLRGLIADLLGGD